MCNRGHRYELQTLAKSVKDAPSSFHPSSNPFRFPFLRPPVFAMLQRKGRGWFPKNACAIRQYPDYTRSRDFPSNFLSHGSLPPRSCFRRAPRALTPSGQKLRFWLICLTAVGSFVLQVWDSASSRLLVDFPNRTLAQPLSGISGFGAAPDNENYRCFSKQYCRKYRNNDR